MGLFSLLSHVERRKAADVVVLPFWQGAKKPKAAASIDSLKNISEMPIAAGDFEGKVGEIVLLYTQDKKEKRCLLLGLGKQGELSVERLRQAYCAVVKLCQKKGIAKVNLVVPTISELRGLSADECIEGISEGILLTNYKWEELVTLDEETVLLSHVTLIGLAPKFLPKVQERETIANGVLAARDLINGNADKVTPSYLVKTAKDIAKRFPKVSVTHFDKKRLEKEKFGLLLAVGRGALHDPALIVVKYEGAPRSREHTVIIGKGVTYDTGGLNMKPGNSMNTMRDDMSGGACALTTVATAAALGLKVNVTAVVPAAENAVGSNSYKPGDVYTSYAKTTVEIGNTDAEGRLILADALAYAEKHLKPTRMVDLATLTGSMVVALGHGMSGLFSDNERLAHSLMSASERSHELLWRMPLFSPYKKQLESDIADTKNVGTRAGGSITAALFLQKFVNKTPWAHIDIAGTAFLDKEDGYCPKNGVGFGVRLLIEWLKS